MNRRTIFLIAAITIAVHVGAFYLLKDSSALPKKRYVAPPNFKVRESNPVISEDGETFVYREYTVSTKLEKRPKFE